MTAHHSLNTALLALIPLALFSTPAEASRRSYAAKAEFNRNETRRMPRLAN